MCENVAEHINPSSYVCSVAILVGNIKCNEPLTISPVAAQCNGACGKRSSIESRRTHRSMLAPEIMEMASKIDSQP